MDLPNLAFKIDWIFQESLNALSKAVSALQMINLQIYKVNLFYLWNNQS